MTNISVKSYRAIGRPADTVQINNLPDEIKSSLHTIYHAMNQVTTEEVKNEFRDTDKPERPLLDMFARHHENVKALADTSKSAAPAKSIKLPKSIYWLHSV